MKKATVICLFVFLGFWIFSKIQFNPQPFEWGHSFTFRNELGFEFDSLEIVLGEIKSTIPNPKNFQDLECNFDLKKGSYPLNVILKVYVDGQFQTLKADSFNCYNCDGSHLYILKFPQAKYSFLH